MGTISSLGNFKSDKRVYKTGFATNQQAYEENVLPLFKSLDRLEKILQNQRYLIGDAVTEAGKFRCKPMLILRHPPLHHHCEIRCGIQGWL